MSYEITTKRIHKELIETFDYLDTIFDFSDGLRQSRLNENEWSINEILEHITLTSHFLLITLKQSLTKVLRRSKESSIPENNSNLEKIIVVGDPDAFDWIRPEHMQPTGKISHLEVRSKMQVQKAECLEILSQIKQGEGNLHRVSMSVQDLGKLNMYEWMYFLIQHAKRHCVEIDRIIKINQPKN